jgi:hypothetical protein
MSKKIEKAVVIPMKFLIIILVLVSIIFSYSVSLAFTWGKNGGPKVQVQKQEIYFQELKDFDEPDENEESSVASDNKIHFINRSSSTANIYEVKKSGKKSFVVGLTSGTFIYKPAVGASMILIKMGDEKNGTSYTDVSAINKIWIITDKGLTIH